MPPRTQAGGGAPPRAIKIVAPGAEADFLAPLAVEALWGCGPKTTERLREMGVSTLGDLARWPTRDLVRRFGKHGYDLGQRARGIDERIVESTFVTKSVGHSSTFLRDQREALPIRRKLRDLAERVGSAFAPPAPARPDRDAHAALVGFHDGHAPDDAADGRQR